MKSRRWQAGIGFTLWFVGMRLSPANAQLPSLDRPPWLGYFTAFSNNRFQFGVSTQGKITLRAMGEKDALVSKSLQIPVEIFVEEIRPDAKPIVKHVKPETLTSLQPATNKLTQAVIHGKVTGDTAFEISLEQDRGRISLGGRLLNQGARSKNPLRFSLRVGFPAAYPRVDPNDLVASKALQKKIQRDRVILTSTDGRRQTLTFDQAFDPTSKNPNPPRDAPTMPLVTITMSVESGAYHGKKFYLGTSPNATITLASTNRAALHKGFSILWQPDPAKDPEGKARLTLEVK